MPIYPNCRHLGSGWLGLLLAIIVCRLWSMYFLKEQERISFQTNASTLKLYFERPLTKIYADFTANDHWVKKSQNL